MDNVSDIIVLLVMVVATIIGAMSKSKKQAAKTPPKQEPDYTYNDSQPAYMEEFAQEEMEVIPIVEYKHPEREKLKMKTTHMPHPDHSEDMEHVLENFDIRNAVIYSEILKPKFEE